MAPGSSTPAPSAVLPPRGADLAPVALTVRGDHFEPEVFSDYGKASRNRLSVTFGAQLESESGAQVPLQNVLWVDSKTLTAVVPLGTPRGHYALVVTDPFGHTGKLADAFEVVSSAENVSSFLFDLIGPQRIGIPFLVGVTAIDQESSPVEGFDGTAALTATTGMIGATSFGPFVRGQFRGFVTVDELADAFSLVAADALGHRGESQQFPVLPGAPARLLFVAGPGSLSAGACGGPFELQTQDTLGKSAPEETELWIDLGADPSEGVTFFEDASCVVPLASARIAPAASQTRFFARALRAGPLNLRAVPVGLPSAVRSVQVDALPATRLVFSSPGTSSRAGDCSSPVELEAQDPYGNRAKVELDLRLAVEATAGVALHADPGCVTPLSALQISAGESGAQFSFRPSAATTLRLVVNGPDGGTFGPIEQSIEVTP